MQDTSAIQTFIRYILGVLLAFLALNAFGGGYYGMAGAENVPTAWLEGSPFQSYFIPSLFLFAVIGGSALIASIAVFRGSHFASQAAFMVGAVVLLWLTIQVIIIGYVSWMQPSTAILVVLILYLSWLLRRYRFLQNE